MFSCVRIAGQASIYGGPQRLAMTVRQIFRSLARRLSRLAAIRSAPLRGHGSKQWRTDVALGIARPRFSPTAPDLPAPVGNITYRAYIRGDEQSMMASFNETFGLNRGLDYWTWKHARPALKSTIVVAVDEANKVQAQFAAMSHLWRNDGGKLRVGFVGDNFCRRHPILVRRNVFLRTIREFHRRHAKDFTFAFIYGIPNEVVRRLLNMLFPSLGPHPIPYLLRSLRDPAPATESAWRIETDAPSAAAADDVWRRTEAAYPRGAARDAAWLLWRYVQRPDVTDYRYITALDADGRIGAWAVLRQQGQTMWVCDLVWDHAHPDALAALDAGIARTSAAAGALVNTMWFQGDAEGEKVLSASGWAPTPNPHPENLVFVVYDEETNFAEFQGSVYFTLGDSDHI